MSGIGKLVVHSRYGKAKVTHTWKKLIDPVKRIAVLDGLTMELLTDKGKALFRRDRRVFFVKEKPLPRVYEGDLKKITLYEPKS